MSVKEEKSPALASALSFVVAGLGQVYNGQIRKGVFVFLTFWLVLPWLFGIVDAYRTASRIQRGELSVKTPTHKEIAVAGAVFIGFFFFALLGIFVVFFHFFRTVAI